MKLDRLTVVHARKSAAHRAPATRGGRDESVFAIETCLRLIWVDLDGAHDLAGLAERFDGDLLRGRDAYHELLKIGCGLESEIPGEAEVFGQVRSAWKRYAAAMPAQARRLEPLMQRLLEDIKDIRTRHLQGHGGATYGSLARLLLGTDMNQPTLVVGAGKMARAVAPYLTGRPLYLWNRTPENLDALMAALRSKDAKDVVRLPADPEAELAGWEKAHTIIVCVPADEQMDRKRLAAWQARAGAGRIVHLGILSTAGTGWKSVANLSTLQDLFALRDSRNELRAGPLARARAACEEKTRLRHLGGSPSLAHGWEDLPFTLTA
jgi:hypothetical protein